MNSSNDKPPAGPIETGQLPLVKAPDAVWSAIEAALANAPVQPRASRPAWIWALAAAAAVAVVGLAVAYRPRTPQPSWQVERLEGPAATPSQASKSTEEIKVGEWLQTDGNSRARISVGDIGTVDVEPNTRVRVVAASPTEHRLTLARGEISARVVAPPRLFLVDTPASTAVDLGCAYTIKTDESGDGLLRVTSGWVSLEWKQRESLVPAGAECRTRSRTGPGTPYFSDAAPALQQALAAFDFAGSQNALDTILSQAHPHDTLTLWHLLSRVAPGERIRVFNRMVELVPLPDSVSREKALELDPATLKSWREELTLTW